VHAEDLSLAAAISLSTTLPRPLHICHVSRRAEIELIARAKAKGFPVTCEVTPHHLFLTQKDAQRLGALGLVRPPLADQSDQDALWEHLGETIDIIASDHAPHTLAEKGSTNPPCGVPGLESTLPLMLSAVSQERLSMDRLRQLLYDNPRRIFNLPEQPETWIEVDPQEEYTFPMHPLYTKCGWSPFTHMPMTGCVKRVVLRGKEVFKDGVVLKSH